MTRDSSPWPHFTRAELECRCGCGAWEMDPWLMERLEAMRLIHGKPIYLSSARRCESHNAEIGGGDNSRHVGFEGGAVDVACYGSTAYELLRLAIVVGIQGIGLKQDGPYSERFIHLDNRSHATAWTYGSK